MVLYTIDLRATCSEGIGLSKWMGNDDTMLMGIAFHKKNEPDDKSLYLQINMVNPPDIHNNRVTTAMYKDNLLHLPPYYKYDGVYMVLIEQAQIITPYYKFRTIRWNEGDLSGKTVGRYLIIFKRPFRLDLSLNKERLSYYF